MKFWPSCAPGRGPAAGRNFFGSALLQPARSVCVSLSAFFIVVIFIVVVVVLYNLINGILPKCLKFSTWNFLSITSQLPSVVGHKEMHSACYKDSRVSNSQTFPVGKRKRFLVGESDLTSGDCCEEKASAGQKLCTRTLRLACAVKPHSIRVYVSIAAQRCRPGKRNAGGGSLGRNQQRLVMGPGKLLTECTPEWDRKQRRSNSIR